MYYYVERSALLFAYKTLTHGWEAKKWNLVGCCVCSRCCIMEHRKKNLPTLSSEDIFPHSRIILPQTQINLSAKLFTSGWFLENFILSQRTSNILSLSSSCSLAFLACLGDHGGNAFYEVRFPPSQISSLARPWLMIIYKRHKRRKLSKNVSRLFIQWGEEKRSRRLAGRQRGQKMKPTKKIWRKIMIF